MRNKLLKDNIIKFFLIGFFIVWVIVPLCHMLMNINIENIQYLIQSPIFSSAIKNSLVSTTISTFLTIMIAYILAFCLERVNIKGKKIFSIIFLLPMLIPSISSGMGVVILFGNNGIITKILNLSHGVYGLLGIIMGSVLYALPVAFLMFVDVLRYEDASSYEAARVLGIPKSRIFIKLTLTYLKKPLITIFFSIFTLILTDYGIPLMIGGKYTTIPVVMYQEVIGQLNFEKGIVYGLLLLIPAVVAFIIDVFNREKNVISISKKHDLQNDIGIKGVAYCICSICAMYTLLPIIAFIMLSFFKGYPKNPVFTWENIAILLELKFNRYLFNSIIIAMTVSCIGVIISFLTAYLTSRMKSKLNSLLHLLAMICATIPGIVLGLAYVLRFKESGIYGTMIILIMVNLVHFISSPYLMMYNSFSKVNGNIEAVAEIMGIHRGYVIKDVLIPMCKNTIMEMFSYFFVNCMITISAVSFLANVSNKPIALLVNQFEAHMQLEYASVVSLIILIINLLIKGIFGWLKDYKGKYKSE